MGPVENDVLSEHISQNITVHLNKVPNLLGSVLIRISWWYSQADRARVSFSQD